MIKVIIAFYSPSDYALPKKYLQSTLQWLRAAGADILLAQVVRENQKPQPAPKGVQQLIFQSQDVLFFKENLWNIAARVCLGNKNVDKLFFIDSDIRFSQDDVVALAAAALDEYDLVQPFEMALWFDKDKQQYLARKCAAYALQQGQEPAPGFFHPGFAWAMTRSAFARLNGWYEGHPFGGGDVAFAYSLDSRWLYNNRTRYLPEDTVCWHSQKFRDYQKNGVEARLKVGYLCGIEAHHPWHGSVENRQYTTRCNYLRIQQGEEYPLRHRADGLLEWLTSDASAAAKQYFDSRKEDG